MNGDVGQYYFLSRASLHLFVQYTNSEIVSQWEKDGKFYLRVRYRLG